MNIKFKQTRQVWRKVKRSYRARIMLSVVLLIMLFLLIGLMEMYFYAREVLLHKTHDFMRSEASSCFTNLENTIEEIEDVTLSILGNTTVQNNLNQQLMGTLDEYDQHMSNEHIRECLSSYALLRTEISSINVVAYDGTIYSYHKNRSAMYDQILKTQEQIYERKGKTKWFVSDSQRTALSCARAINYLPSQTTLGFVSVNISESYVRALYTELITPGLGEAFLLDENNRVLSSNSGIMLGEMMDGEYTDLLSTGQEVYHVQENGDTVYVSEELPNHWRLMLTVSASYYLEGLNRLSKVFLLSAVAMTALAALVLYGLMLHLTRPISNLARAMEDFGAGNLEAHCNVTTEDEIGMLGNTFNKMIEDMHQLYVTAYEQQILRQDAELRALQMQINPHFLYNTLDTINWKARFSGVDDVGDMAYCLGCLLRHSLAPGDFTVLSKEIASLEYYLKIQNYRYSDRLTTTLDIDPSFRNMDIPKLLIQPIVENAIIHGVEEKIEGGSIRVWAELEGEIDFLIHVDDDGVGMTPEVRERVLSGDRDFRKKSHIGVYNVHRRIQLYYGKGYGLEIQSAPGKGTRVTLRIKALREPEDVFQSVQESG